MVLFNPSVDTPRNPAIVDTLIGRELEASPLRHVEKGIAPAILFHGTADEIVPIADAEAFCTALRKVGSRCEVVRYEGQGHGFASAHRSETKAAYADTIAKADAFLKSLHLMQ